MKKTAQRIRQLIIISLIALVGAVIWHEYSRPIKETGPQKLYLDLSHPGPGELPSPWKFVSAGRKGHHQQGGHALFAMTEQRDQDQLLVEGTAKLTVPPGAELTFDLFVPPLLLMDYKSKVHFSIEFSTGNGEIENIFDYNYRLDWIAFCLNQLRERTQKDYEFIDRFRHFTIDLSKFSGQSGELSFSVKGQAPLPESYEKDLDLLMNASENSKEKSPKVSALAKYIFKSGTKFSEGFNFISPKIWTTAQREEKDFNIVFCFVDGLRPDALSVYGYDKQTAPNILAFAEKGTLFETVYAPSNGTRNSITAILSGRYPSTLGIPFLRWDLKDEEKTAFKLLTGNQDGATPSLPLYLTQKGYATGFVGSNPFIFPGNYIAADLGFSVNESLNHRKFDTVAITERAENFIDANKDRPFFLYLHFDNCHGDFRPPKEFKEKWTRADGEKGANWPAAYDAEVAYADENIGQILAHLEKQGLAEKTLFVITSDHGMSYEPGHPFGHTHSLYESEIRVPLIMAFPGRIPANKRISGLKSLLDLYPTIIKMRGEEYSNTNDLLSFAGNHISGLPLNGNDLFGMQQNEELTQRTIYVEGAGITALRQNNNKMIVKIAPYEKLKSHPSSDKGRLLEIYNLEKDPKELSNLADTEEEKEQLFLEKVWHRKINFSRQREEQINRLSNYMLSIGNQLHPLLPKYKNLHN